MNSNLSVRLLLAFFTLVLAVSAPPIHASDILNAWTNTTSLDDTYVNNRAVVYGNRLYLLGGTSNIGPTRSNVRSNTINANGGLGAWSSQPSMNNMLIWHSSVLINSRIYIIGGVEEPPINSINKISYADIDPSGNLSNWTDQPTDKLLPENLGLGSTAVVGNYIFYLGGAVWNGGWPPTISDDIYVSHIDGGGNLGSWSAANIKLPTPLAAFGTVVDGNRIYVLGGSTSSSFSPTNTVYVFEVNLSNGQLTRLADEGNLPLVSRTAMITRVGDYVIHAGGVIGPGPATNQVWFAPIDGSGIGTWEQSTNSLPQINCCTAITAWGDYIYILGGHDNAGPYYNSVIYSKLSSEPDLPNLSVPDIKQYTPPWNDDEYDTATNWSNNPTIESWGCALTSAAMVLQHHGHTNANPDTLNNWLKTQPDGYVRNGLINWLAVSRYTRINDSPSSPTLEYRRLGNSTANLQSELEAERPAILEQPGHFVVGKSQTESSYGINDPAYSNRPTLASYSNSFLSLGSYRPTHTDLSYIMLAINSDFDLQVLSATGSAVGESFIQQPLVDDTDETQTSGQNLKVFMFPTPEQGSYTVTVSGDGLYQLDSFLYDSQGNVTQNLHSGLVGNNNPDQFEIVIGTSSITTPEITIDQIIKDVNQAFIQGKIKLSKYIPLKINLEAARAFINSGSIKQAKKSLSQALKFLDSSPTSQVIKNEIQSLINSL